MKMYQETIHLLSLEKDDERNSTQMQLRLWCLNNRTTLVVRLFKHSPDAGEVLWNGIRTNGEVNLFVLNFLHKIRIVKEPQNWEYSIDKANDFRKQDPFEEKGNCSYYAFEVKEHLLRF